MYVHVLLVSFCWCALIVHKPLSLIVQRVTFICFAFALIRTSLLLHVFSRVCVQQPWYKNFAGTIAHVEPQRYVAYGSVGRLSPTSVEITELPIRTWIQTYKENVLEPMLHGTEKTPSFIT